MRPNELKSSIVSANLRQQFETGQARCPAHYSAQWVRNRPPTQAKRDEVLLPA